MDNFELFAGTVEHRHGWQSKVTITINEDVFRVVTGRVVFESRRAALKNAMKMKQAIRINMSRTQHMN